MPVCSRPNWNSEVVVFKERGKPEKNLSEKGRELTTTNSTRARATLFLVGGECSHHRTALAPQDCLSTVSENHTIKYFLGTDEISHTTQSLSPLNTGEISPNHSGGKNSRFCEILAAVNISPTFLFPSSRMQSGV